MKITFETRRESYDAILETLNTRQTVVLQELQRCPRLTANELAMRLWRKGAIRTPERNAVQPRLTELVQDGRVATVGKRTCSISGKKCAVYVTVDEQPEQG
ncbi:hypothetical protein [Desmospora activa]|uniref:MarR family transcriptional regulator n=1 Tax=Desmospora activa DSM 45169 TaxID=1121389 RepID=A0A2T4Z907_9BACL|nr:hypothetical protein [Desmospora activa]PTM58355.1 hypothetical protein C8J48_0937 [Desmospora activa DSM 45169]